MALRAPLPGELVLDAIVCYPRRALDTQVGNRQSTDWAHPVAWDERTLERVKRRQPYVALRWVLQPGLGIPLEPFTVWRRPAFSREATTPIPGAQWAGSRYVWDGISEMMRIEVDLVGSATVTGLGRAELGAVQAVTGTAGQTLVLDAGPMLLLDVDDPGAVGAVRGLSLVTMANGAGWQEFEIVGLPWGPPLVGSTYYSGSQQGPVGALTDPESAAVQRLKTWGPVLGWTPLAGLPPWQPPDPSRLVEEMQGNVLPDLATVMTANPPPLVASQVAASVEHKLDEVRQIIGVRSRLMNGGGVGDRSALTVRPLQSLTSAVAVDTWASLALGFGTGDALATGDVAGKGGFDYMVTAPWRGLMQVPIPTSWPWWVQPQPDPLYVTEEVDRELAAVVLAPTVRPAPPAPAPVSVTVGLEEGADSVDAPYHSGIVLRTVRPPVLPRQPRTSGYALARYDGPAVAAYQMREHPLAQGWIPMGSSEPVRASSDPPDPALIPGTAMLRNSGVARPITGAPAAYQYALAATDLFGQWSPWSAAWLSLGVAEVQAPVVAAVRARAVAGAGGIDPCPLAATVEVSWNARERSLGRLHLALDVYVSTPAPPAPYDEPPGSPQGGSTTVRDLVIPFDTDGSPASSLPAGVSVDWVHDDDTPVVPLDDVGDSRRYRIVVSGIDVTFGAEHELAVAAYAQAEEHIRPGEWSGWAHTREAALPGNPLPAPAPAALAVVYPDWASLPDGAGLSTTTLTWTPTGAWRYAVYEANEASLRAACGLAAPDLTDGYGGRMQALFDLYKDPGNLEKLRASYRKLGQDPILPPVQPDGTMNLVVPLPRGSSLVHCYVVVGVTEANVVSDWPTPDGDGRRAFHAFVIPHALRPSAPEITATTTTTGAIDVTARVRDLVPATSLRLYRTTSAILSRSVGTMELVATVATNPGSWAETTVTDPAPPTGWSRVQYRLVALTDDDRDHAGMAVPSEPSRAFAILDPPPDAPTLAVQPNVLGSTSTVSVVRLDTDALTKPTDAGNFTLSARVTRIGKAVKRVGLADLTAVPSVASTAVLAASATTPVAYVGGVLHLRVDRDPGEDVGLAVDVTDPIDRTTHVVVDVAAYVPDPAPVVTLTAARAAGIVHLLIDTNVTLPPDPSRDWTLRIATKRVLPWPPTPPSSRTFLMSAITTIATAADMPDPLLVPDPFAIRRIDGTGEVLLWARSPFALRVGVTLTNSESTSATAMKVTP